MEQKVTIKLTITPTKKEKLQFYTKEMNYKSISSFVDIATDFYLSKNLHAGDVSSTFFELNHYISQLEDTSLTPKQQNLVNNIKERMDTVYGYFQD